MNASIRSLLLSIGLVGGAFAAAQVPPAMTSTEPVAYPSRGQDAKQQDMDRYQCFDWARGQSGFDPTRTTTVAPGTSATSAPTSHTGIGPIARMKEQQAAEARTARQAQATQQQAATRQQQKAGYDRAFGACMEGRGYTVR